MREPDTEEKPGLIRCPGNKPIEIPELHAGDIGAIAKLLRTQRQVTLFLLRIHRFCMEKTEYSVPYTYMKYDVKTKGDEDKVSQALAKMMAEDITLKTVNDSENRQTLLYGMGDQHLEVAVSKLASRYKVDVYLDTPRLRSVRRSKEIFQMLTANIRNSPADTGSTDM